MGTVRDAYLVDTHVLLWLLTDPTRLSATAAALLADPANRVFASTASAWELATKHRLGKLPQADVLVTGYTRHLKRAEVETIEVSVEHAILGGGLDWEHRDPFDRVIAATAMVEGLALVSADPVFDGLNGLRVAW